MKFIVVHLRHGKNTGRESEPEINHTISCLILF